MSLIRIHLSINTLQAHWRRILEGVSEFATCQKLPWHLSRDWGVTLSGKEHLSHYQGAILQSSGVEPYSSLKKLKIPCVLTGATTNPGRLPAVLPDSRAIGQLAADHFLERGFQHFAYFGTDSHWYSRERLAGFKKGLKGKQPAIYAPETHREADIMKWLQSLPSGTALFSANDTFARASSNRLLSLGRSMPEEIALLGVDNDEIETALASIPLSSIDPRSREVGFEAALLLEELIRGRSPRHTPRLVAPGGVFIRQSSDLIAVEDQVVGKALALIRDQACSGLTVKKVLQSAPVSRRTLERRLQEAIGRGIEEEIRRIRLERAKELLARTDLSVGEVADRSGFSDIFYFSAAFRKGVGLTPSAWRKERSAR